MTKTTDGSDPFPLRFIPLLCQTAMMTFENLLVDRVNAALLRSPHYLGKSLRLEASEDQIVLHGVVDSFYQKQVAQEIVRRVDGVRRVENRLEVALSESLLA